MNFIYKKNIFYILSSLAVSLFLFIITYFFPQFSVEAKENAAPSKEKLIFSGGPSGGTFQTTVQSIQSFKAIKESAGFKISSQSSNGSIDNLKNIDSGSCQMGIVYSGDLWRGINGKLETSDKTNNSGSDTPQIYSKVMAAAYLFSEPAQLVVHSDSGIKNVKELEGKRVGVGNINSGTYSSCELFFKHIGIWDKIEKNYIGNDAAAYSFKNNEIDAFWIFSALPSPAAAIAADHKEDAGTKSLIQILNLGDDADKSGFSKEYPWFSTALIKAGTYKGVDSDIISFQDSAIWAVSSDVPSDVVYQILSIVYADDCLNYLYQQSEILKEMSIETGIIGIVTQFHPGAEKFWKEKSIIK